MGSILDIVLGHELFFIYSLIAIVIVLILVIVIVGKKESKKKTPNLFDTLNLKIIANPDEIRTDNTSSVVNIKKELKKEEFKDLEPIPKVNTVYSEKVKETLEEVLDDEDSDDIYVESDLEKTQAQLRVEEITKALKEAEMKELNKKDKYEQFEEEQEKNAIISFNELMASYDKLYSENEKIQYIDDENIPINIDELYELQKDNKESKSVPVKIEELIPETKTNTKTSSFKSSPYISPVYGIQKPPVDSRNNTDIEIENANNFLKTLKDLKNNLE